MKYQIGEFHKVPNHAAHIIEECGANLELTSAEIRDIVVRIRTKSSILVAHMGQDDEKRYDPMRVAFLGILDWRKSEARWYTPFRNARRQSILKKFADGWSSIDPHGTAARAINPEAARMADLKA